MKCHSVSVQMGWISTVVFCIVSWMNLATGIYAQSSPLDSLRQVIKNPESGHEQRASAYLDLVRAYSQISTDSALMYAELGLESARQANSPLWVGSAYRYRGMVRYIRQEYALSLDDFHEALDHLPAEPDSAKLKAVYNSIGNLYYKLGNHAQAMAAYRQALDFSEAQTNSLKAQQIAIYNNIAACYVSMKSYPEAKALLRQTLSMARDLSDKTMEGVSYQYLTAIFEHEARYDSAAHYYTLAMAKYLEVNDKRRYAHTSVEAAPALAKIGRIQEAMHYCVEALTYAQEAKLPQLEVAVRQSLSTLYLMSDNFAKALSHAEQGISLCDTLHSPPPPLLLGNAAKANMGMGRWETAAHLLLRAYEMQDTLRSNEEEKQLMALRQSFALGQKDQEHALKQAVLTGQRNISFTAWIFTLVLLTIIAIALINRNRQNQQIRRQREELQLLNQLKDRFFTLLSHDLRAPIAKGRSLLGTLAQQPGSDHVRQHFEEISSMLEQLLMWAKSQLNYIKVSRVSTNLYSLTASLETFFYMEASEKSLTLINNIPANMHTLTDPNILEVALRNLLSNALRHTPPEGTVVLSAQQELNGAVCVYITDTGAGIDDSLCGQLSSKQILQAVGSRSGGSGVGLLLSHDMVALLGGQLYARRLDEGGSEFKIVLPVVG